jgi:hypothetical protein
MSSATVSDVATDMARLGWIYVEVEDKGSRSELCLLISLEDQVGLEVFAVEEVRPVMESPVGDGLLGAYGWKGGRTTHEGDGSRWSIDGVGIDFQCDYGTATLRLEENKVHPGRHQFVTNGGDDIRFSSSVDHGLE